MSEINLLNVILNQLREKGNLPEIKLWNNSNYSELSDLIYEDTGILLSRNTLKYLVQKVVAKDKNYSPQQSTKDALCQYIGHENWRNFKAQFDTDIAPEKGFDFRNKFSLIKNNWKGLFVVVLVLILVLLGGKYVRFSDTMLHYSFSVSDSVGTAPHTISLKYNFENISKDSVFVDFDTYSAAGNYEFKYFKPSKGVENFCFYHPGLYKCVLYVGNSPTEKFDVFIQSKGWSASVYDAQVDYSKIPDVVKQHKIFRPKYVAFDNVLLTDIIRNGRMTVTPEQVAVMKDIPKNYKTEFSLYKDFNVSGDDFTFKAIFGNEYFGEETYCYSALFTLIGEKGRHYFRITQPGCKLFAKYRFSEVHTDGIYNEISGFEHDFSSQRLVVFKNTNQTIELSIDGETFHEDSYKKSIGKILGIQLTFKGAASVNYIELIDGDGDVKFKDDF